jgi:hypothetical protein
MIHTDSPFEVVERPFLSRNHAVGLVAAWQELRFRYTYAPPLYDTVTYKNIS